jgi:signal transduction histidine kinase
MSDSAMTTEPIADPDVVREPHLKPEELDLPAAEIHRLYAATWGVMYNMSHDFSGDLRTALASNSLITKQLEKLEETMPGIAENPAFGLLKRRLEAIQRGLDLTGRRIRSLLFVDREEGDVFVSIPATIVRNLAARFPDAAIEIAPQNSVHLEILYPQMVLKGFLQELVRNALSASNRPRIRFSWRLNHDTFIIDVEDDGPGFSDLGPGQKREIHDRTGTGERHGGLNIWGRLINHMGGLVLLGRSDALGGAAVSVHLRVTASYDLGPDGNGHVKVTVDK